MIVAIKNSVLAIACSLLLISCNDESRFFEQQIELENSSWNRDVIPEFTFDIQDTSQAYHIIYTVRNGKNYPFYNLYLESELIDSTGLIAETFFKEIYLFDANTGKPFGSSGNFINSALGDVYDGRYLCKSYYKFPRPGTYSFNIKQFMREQASLEDVIAIGLRIEIPKK